MPYVPLTPEEQKLYPPPCTDSQHNPPRNNAFGLNDSEVRKWQCPGCGKEQIVFPMPVYMTNWVLRPAMVAPDVEYTKESWSSK